MWGRARGSPEFVAVSLQRRASKCHQRHACASSLTRGHESRHVKKRLGDRRSRPRFDVVGSLAGQIEIWQLSEVHNLGLGGALVDSTLPLSPGTQVSGRLSAGRELSRVRADVVHAAPTGRGRQLFGLSWIDIPSSIEDVIGALVPEAEDNDLTANLPEPLETDRRHTRRYPADGEASLELAVTLPAAVIDISASGALVSTNSPLEPGSTAQLNMRLGDHDFTSRIEIRRAFPTEAGDWRLGVHFVALDEANRRSLDTLLTPKL
jgi:hypothetical protein